MLKAEILWILGNNTNNSRSMMYTMNKQQFEHTIYGIQNNTLSPEVKPLNLLTTNWICQILDRHAKETINETANLYSNIRESKSFSSLKRFAFNTWTHIESTIRNVSDICFINYITLHLYSFEYNYRVESYPSSYHALSLHF